MRAIYIILINLLTFQSVYSQGQIMGFTIDPANPTELDYVKVYVDIMFTSGSCDVDNQGHTTVDSITNASALHCVGMLTVICDTRDTFNLGYLDPGTHKFKFTLSSGFGGPGCSPGVAPDDRDSISFNVINILGTNELYKNNLVRVFPNPMQANSILKIDASLNLIQPQLIITDALGKVVKTISSVVNNTIFIERSQLNSGIYFYRLNDGSEIIAVGKLVIE